MSEAQDQEAVASSPGRTLVLTSQQLALRDMTLDDLAQVVNEEHSQVQIALSHGVMRAIRAGEALLEARERVPKGEWVSWIEDNLEVDRGIVKTYMRLAYYQEELLASGRGSSVKEAVAALRGLPGIARSYGPVKSDEAKREAKRLHEKGVPLREIARLLDTTHTTVKMWVDPEFKRKRLKEGRERNRQVSAAKRALRRQEREKAIKRIGGSAAGAYSLIRRCAVELDQAIQNVEHRELEVALRSALENLYKAEDDVVRALGVDR
jgi:DNA-binding transcriptional MerR regulator